MFQKTYFDKVKPYIIRKGDKYTKEEFKELAEKTDKIGEEFADDVEWVFDSVDLNKYYVSANPYNVLCERRALVELHKDEETIVYIPSFIANNKKKLSDLYKACKVKGKVYSHQHPDVVHCRDTDNYVLREDAYDVMGIGYHEKKDGLVSIGEQDEDVWTLEKYAVITQDMGYKWFRNDCYCYRDDEGEKQYYRYRNLAPDAGRRIIRFNESKFPKPDEINEERIGIEFEYISAVDASVAVLKNKRFRDKWDSVRDGSLVPDGLPKHQEKSTEFVSVPFKIENVEKEVKDFLNFAERHGARISKKCGFHVHVGSPRLNFNALTSLVLLCENIEEDLFRLVPDHRQNNEYCAKLDSSFKGFEAALTKGYDEEQVAEIFYEGQATANNRKNQGKWNVGDKRHFWLSIDRFWYCKDEPHKRTVEFRMHHATHNAEEFNQFVLLCYYITKYALNNSSTVCRKTDLSRILDSIPNRRHLMKINNLLHSKKVIS